MPRSNRLSFPDKRCSTIPERMIAKLIDGRPQRGVYCSSSTAPKSYSAQSADYGWVCVNKIYRGSIAPWRERCTTQN
jgi:hypothetical protein